ncbi:MAG: LSU ribosomal protein L17p [uncultured Segetibacter sp.]|uniref:Large ribosomal subunit protein bL17 n=1 Tax=uncultured Segetibacter sp. TaxID=481133 RepID=A0A6J4SI07_9BACT|nr:MAG: LSU ribosomal protein L17p [uncultured Segetibacter sp.]
MRHGDKINNLGRKAGHRAALLSNLASQLIANKRITTTLAKAKALRTYVEPLITKAKDNTTHQRRIVFSYLQDKEAIKELFDVVRLKIEGRPGGYTRIIKLGTRVGDNAELALIELVDYNEVYGKGTAAQQDTAGKRTRRAGSRRRGGGGGGATPQAPSAEVTSAAELPAATDAVADEAVINNNTEEQNKAAE